MKRKLLKKILPFLLTFAMMGGNVYAGESNANAGEGNNLTQEMYGEADGSETEGSDADGARTDHEADETGGESGEGEAADSDGNTAASNEAAEDSDTTEGGVASEDGGATGSSDSSEDDNASEDGDSTESSAPEEDDNASEEDGAAESSDPAEDDNASEEDGAAESSDPAEDDNASEEDGAAGSSDSSEDDNASEDGDSAESSAPEDDNNASEEDDSMESSDPAEDIADSEDSDQDEDSAEESTSGAGDSEKETAEEPSAETERSDEQTDASEQVETLELQDEITGEVYYATVYTATNGFKFYLDWANNAVITGYNGSPSTLKIPAKVTYGGKTYNVTTIGESAFESVNSLTRVDIEEGITSIEFGAFDRCSNLKTVNFPKTLKTIDAWAFSRTAISSLNLKEGLVTIGIAAFQDCDALTTVTFPKTLREIAAQAFYDCDALGSVILNEGLTSLVGNPFESCDNLRVVDIPGSVVTIPGGAFSVCKNLVNVSLHNGTEKIEDWAFHYSAVNTISIPKSVKEIGSNAFTNSKLSTVYCSQGSAADDASLYPSGTQILYGSMKVEPPVFTITNYIGGRDVTMKTATPNAIIYYSNSQNITTKDKWVANNSRVSFDKHTGYLYARAYYSGQWSTVSRIALTIPVVSTPVITFSGDRVTVSTGTADSTIYYTTDGSDPSVSHGTKIAGSSGSFTLVKGTVKAIAVKNGCTNSAIAKTEVGPVYSSSIGVPAFNVKGVVGGRTVTFTSATKGGKIYYSASSSTLTTKDKSVANGGSVTFTDFYGTIYARTYVNGKWSNAARLILKIPNTNTPVITQNKNTVTISTSTPNATIYYTTDGSTPSPTNGKKISGSTGSFTVGKSVTVKAIAVRSCFTNSGIAVRTTEAAAEYDSSIGVPSFTVKGVVGGRTVTFRTSTPGAYIYYSRYSDMTNGYAYRVSNGSSVTFNDFYGTLYARAYVNGKWSNVSRLILKIPVVNTPSITRSGSYVTIRTSTPDCTIYYTTDGSTPSPTNGYRINASSGRVYVGTNRTVRAVAVRSCFGNSKIATAR